MSIPKTEMRNPQSAGFSEKSNEEMALLVIRANYEAVSAVERASGQIATAIEAISAAFERGNHLIYVGAGTSGRLAIVDASECPPTFGVPSEQVSAVLAGGVDKILGAGEIEEDYYEDGQRDLIKHGIAEGDIVVGISAAGNAAYVIGALERARLSGCITVGLSCNSDAEILKISDIPIFTDTGAEVLTGSTRLKAGTAQKIVLNTLTTCAMAKTGKVYDNMMINLLPSNKKLRKRVVSITMEIAGCGEEAAISALEKNGWLIKDAVEYIKNNKL